MQDQNTTRPASSPRRKGFLARPVMTGAAAIALAGAAFGAGQIMQPAETVAQAIRPQAPAAASALPSFADLVERVSPAVVSLQVISEGPRANDRTRRGLEMLPPSLREELQRRGGDQPRERMGGGSGFFISEDGFIVTNNHVVENANQITVTLKDGRELRARVVGTDPRTDIAVIKVDGGRFPYVEFAPDARLRVGDWVVAIGNPFGLGGTATAGIVSATGRDIGTGGNISDFIQIDAPINPGNSGGPTFNMRGQVVGVNTAIFSTDGGSDGIGFAVPASLAQNVTRQIRASGSVTYGWLGVAVQSLTPDMAASYGLANSNGALVGSVTPDSPASRAGLKREEVVVSINGQAVTSSTDLTRRIGQVPVGTTVRLEVVTPEGQRRTVPVRIDARPSEQRLAELSGAASAATASGGKPESSTETAVVEPRVVLGMGLVPIDEISRRRLRLEDDKAGLIVRSVEPRSEASRRGLRPGDAVLEVNGQPVNDVTTLQQAIDTARSANRSAVRLYVQSQSGASGFLALPLEQ